MSDQQVQPNRPVRNWGLIGAVAAAVAASACCVLPLLLAVVGVGGAWVGSLTALEPYRPVFVALSVAALGFAVYREYRTSPGPECDCEVTVRDQTRRILLGFAVLAVLGLIVSPTIISLASQGSDVPATVAESGLQEVTLELENMTCTSCEVTVREALERVEGVTVLQVMAEPPQAVVRYDSSRHSWEALVEATTSAGYPSRIQ